MGSFFVDVTLRPVGDRSKGVVVPRMLVDTGAEATWVPAGVLEQLGIPREPPHKRETFTTADGRPVTRDVGFAVVEVTPQFYTFYTVDEVVFGEPGDLPLLGARSMEGLGCRVDPEGKQLVAAGPKYAAGNVPGRPTLTTKDH